MSSVGTLIAEFRKRHHYSQLDLSTLADVSPRHISFLETGRSRPSREMLLRLAETLGLTLQESNLLLHSAGFAAVYSSYTLDSEEMAPVREALTMMLEKQNPYPALVLDGDWNIVMANAGQQRLAAGLGVDKIDSGSSNLLELVFAEAGYRPMIANWEQVAAHLLRRLRRQVIAYSRPGHVALLNKLLAMDPPEDWQQPEITSTQSPVLTVDLFADRQVLKLFSTLSQFGTALDTGTEEVIIENYFPANELTRQFFATTG